MIQIIMDEDCLYKQLLMLAMYRLFAINLKVDYIENFEVSLLCSTLKLYLSLVDKIRRT
jgi:hypothetical protein